MYNVQWNRYFYAIIILTTYTRYKNRRVYSVEIEYYYCSDVIFCSFDSSSTFNYLYRITRAYRVVQQTTIFLLFRKEQFITRVPNNNLFRRSLIVPGRKNLGTTTTDRQQKPISSSLTPHINGRKDYLIEKKQVSNKTNHDMSSFNLKGIFFNKRPMKLINFLFVVLFETSLGTKYT